MLSFVLLLIAFCVSCFSLSCLALGPGQLSFGQRLDRSGAALGLGTLCLGMILLQGAELSWFAASVLPAAKFADLGGTMVAGLFMPWVVAGMADQADPRKRRSMRRLRGVSAPLAALCLLGSLVGVPGLARWWLFASIAACLVLAAWLRRPTGGASGNPLWRRLAWVLLPGLPLLILNQLCLALPGLAALGSRLRGLDVAWFSAALCLALAADCLPRPDWARRPTTPPDPALSPQKLAIARLLAEGLSYKEIACRLGIAPKTVDHHLQDLYRRHGVGTRHALVQKLFPREHSPSPPG